MGYEYFTDKELSCRCCGEQKMSPEFMAKVAALRKQLGFPFIVTSAYRCPKYNASVSSSGVHGPHTTGRAIDISVRGLDAVRLLEAALNSHQFTGVGIQQKGEGRFIHLDDLKGPDYPRPALWSY